jgi:membrane-bound serine protease (ClpP class)
VPRPMTLPERILHAITDPNIAYLLFTLGLLGLAVELWSPGLMFPGVAGAISLILAFVAFGSLPVNWAGVVLLLFGIALVIADAVSEGIGVLSVGGIVAFVLGSLMLYRPPGRITPATPALSISIWLIATVAVLAALFAFIVLRGAVKSRHLPVQTGLSALLGESGLAISDMAPRGTVRVHGEEWSAIADDPPIRSGDSVAVTGMEGVTLKVRRIGGA